MPYQRPERETDPAKRPGQIINRHPQAMLLRDIIAKIDKQEKEDGFCPVLAQEHRDAVYRVEAWVGSCRCTEPSVPCEGCPNA